MRCKNNILLIMAVWATGVLIHFVYGALGENVVVGAIGAINESVWEHFKLVFYPILGMTIYLGVKNGHGIGAVGVAASAALLHGALMLFGIFYAYTGAFGTKPILFIDILSFFLTSVVSFYIMKRHLALKISKTVGILGVVLTGIMLFCVIVFTYLPPNLPIFREL